MVGQAGAGSSRALRAKGTSPTAGYEGATRPASTSLHAPAPGEQPACLPSDGRLRSEPLSLPTPTRSGAQAGTTGSITVTNHHQQRAHDRHAPGHQSQPEPTIWPDRQANRRVRSPPATHQYRASAGGPVPAWPCAGRSGEPACADINPTSTSNKRSPRSYRAHDRRHHCVDAHRAARWWGKSHETPARSTRPATTWWPSSAVGRVPSSGVTASSRGSRWPALGGG